MEINWRSPQREKAIKEWWGKVKANHSFSGGVKDLDWDELVDAQQDDLWEIFVTHIYFGDT